MYGNSGMGRKHRTQVTGKGLVEKASLEEQGYTGYWKYMDLEVKRFSKLGVVPHICNLNTQDKGTIGSQVES